MMAWLRTRIAVDPAIEHQAEEMLKAYGSEAYAISSHLARDKRNKGEAEHARHWAKVDGLHCRLTEESPRHSPSFMTPGVSAPRHRPTAFQLRRNGGWSVPYCMKHALARET